MTSLAPAWKPVILLAMAVFGLSGASASAIGGHSAWRFVGVAPAASNGSRSPVTAISFDPDDSSILIVGTNDGVFRVSTHDGVFRGPASGTGQLLITDLARNPADPNVLYAAAFGDGVWKTVDRGATWSRTADVPDAFLWRLAIDPFRPATISGAAGEVLVRSEDAGASWTSVPLAAAASHAWPQSIQFDQTTPGLVYAGTAEKEIFRSTDHGVSWQSIDPLGMPSVIVQSIASDSAGGALYASLVNDVGCVPELPCSPVPPSFIRSLDDGAHWDTLAVGPLATAFDVALGSGNPAVVVLSGPDGILESRDRGQTWETVGGEPFEGPTAGVTLNAGGTHLATTTAEGLWVDEPIRIVAGTGRPPARVVRP